MTEGMAAGEEGEFASIGGAYVCTVKSCGGEGVAVAGAAEERGAGCTAVVVVAEWDMASKSGGG